MKALTHFRDWMIKQARLDPAMVTIWADKGTLRSAFGTDNQAFLVEYCGNLVVQGYAGPLDGLLYWAHRWYQDHQASLQKDGVTFDAELESRHSADIYFSVPIRENIAVQSRADGRGLRAQVGAPPLQDLGPTDADIQPLFNPGGPPKVGGPSGHG